MWGYIKMIAGLKQIKKFYGFDTATESYVLTVPVLVLVFDYNKLKKHLTILN